MSAVGQPWFWYTVILAIAVLGYFRTPDTWTQTIVYDSIAVSGVLAMAIGVRRTGPRPPACG